MSHARPLDPELRAAHYLAGGRRRFTARQARRMRHKEHKLYGPDQEGTGRHRRERNTA